ncbi:CoA transferase [Phytohabitans kaempferiae]|uniref:CoA transferase n=1 Tax=Phytohabitans kaempferiae TaxID=1620943 RepID=A0ABV6MA98_9ACTN
MAPLDALETDLAEAFKRKTQAEWAEIFDGTDGCVAPILPFSEAVRHPHIAARGVFAEHEGRVQPAPRFSRTEATLSKGPSAPGQDTRVALGAWGIGTSTS